MALLRLFDPVNQFQTKSGALNTAGLLRVYLNGTDDYAAVHDDNGTMLEQPVRLDNNGRAPGLFVDSGKVYRLEVQDRYGSLLFTVNGMVPSGGGAGSSLGDKYDVVSSDGSISVDRSVDAGTTTYDIGLAPNDSDEFLEWIKCSEKDCGSTWYPVFQDGSMETEAGKGIKVHKGHLYHFTNSFTVDPDGTGVNYDTFRVAMYCGDDIVDEHDFDIDSSLNDPVLCEFSRDVVPSEDTHVYFKLSIPATCKASGEVQCHRIYSGINAVPDTCATKQWVSASYQPLSGMSSYVPYSAVGNNSMGQVTGINGSAIAGGLDSASVSSIASSVASAYTESAFSSLSSKADSSALSAYQPVSAMGAYATTAYVDGRMSGKLDTTAFNSGDFYTTANPSGFVDSSYVASSVSGKLDTTAFASASAGFAPAGDYAFNSSLSSYIPASASGAFQLSGDYAFNSAVSSKLDASASGDFVANSAMTSWIPYSALGYSGTSISSIGGSSLAGMGGGGVTGDYVEKSATEVAIGSGLTAYLTAFAQGVDCGASARSFTQGFYNTASATSFSQGQNNTATNTSFAQGYGNSAQSNSLTQGYVNRAYAYSFAQGRNNTASNNSFAQGSSNTATSNSFAQGHHNTATNASFAQGSWNSANSDSFAQGFKNSADLNSFALGEYNSADSHSFAQGIKNSANSDSFAQGIGNSAVYTATVFGSYNLHGNGYTANGGDSAAFAIGDGTATNARHDLMLVTKNGEITMYSSTADTVGLGLVSSIKAISAAATGGVDSATVSAIASAYTTGKQDTLAFAYNSADQISSINGSALGGMDEAAVSGIASAYAQSAASSKLDTSAFNSGDFYSTSNPSGFITGVDLRPYQEKSAMTAYQPSGDYAYNSSLSGYIPTSESSKYVTSLAGYATESYVDSTVSGKLDSSAFNPADFYSTANPSGFITGVDLTPYQPTSAMSAYATTAYVTSGLSGKENVFSAGTGLEFVQSGSDRVLQVEAPVDIVAGPGIVIDNPDGNTLRVSVDQAIETVLWEGTRNWWSDTSNLQLSEAASNFEVIRVKVKDDWALSPTFIFFPGNNAGFDVSLIGYESGNLAIKTSKFSVSGSTVSFAEKISCQVKPDKTVNVNTDQSFIQFIEIVGIHRIAGGN